eukprot:scaffold1696_cov258-Pinguiococcus_pyrenoidosus.AAC.29
MARVSLCSISSSKVALVPHLGKPTMSMAGAQKAASELLVAVEKLEYLCASGSASSLAAKQ